MLRMCSENLFSDFKNADPPLEFIMVKSVRFGSHFAAHPKGNTVAGTPVTESAMSPHQ